MTTQERKRLAAVVRRYRQKRGLGVREVARALEVNPGWLGRIESGDLKQPSFERLQALADVLDAPADELFIAAGYEPSALPEMGAYFRAKYGLGNDEVDDIEQYVRSVQKRSGDKK
jgi:transcriptional regulator with XRE-family HTH domain